MRASRFVAMSFALAVSTRQASPVRADAPASESTVVARVGSRTITADEMNRRIAALPPFQIRGFGKSPDEVRRNFLERVLIREALLAEAAKDRKLDAREDVKGRLRGALQRAMLARVRAEAASTAKVSPEDVKRYYEANPARFHAPARIAIWRILVGTKEEAEGLLKQLKAEPTAKRWSDVAREKSLDASTRMRGGNMGFVAPDGTTPEPGLKTDVAVVAAATAVEDGKIVPDPVQEGDRWAVIWRRQSMKAVDRPLEIESAAIEQVLSHERGEQRVTALIDQLRKDHLQAFEPALVDAIEIQPSGELGGARRGASASAAPSAISAPPKPHGRPAPSADPDGDLR
jgi:peptidyl-prolyl cis-trans isomerase C